ncbi:hypothetical protein B0H12DRAFT_85559 [Mycena haematopus]|nr:hypothetical protein B0H12DRAFT_85559 [Mycena haematopus]
MPKAMTIEPRLPPDLERTIFELAAHKDTQTALRIILVAHRCRSWIEPILYRSVVVSQSSWSFPLFLRTLDARPHMLDGFEKFRSTPICCQTTLQSLVSCLHAPLSSAHRPLVRADVVPGFVPAAVDKIVHNLDIIDGLAEVAYFHHPAFAQLTHLHVLDAPQRWPHVPFSALPALTHLALQNYKNQIRPTNVPVLQKILTECQQLEVLVVFVPFCPADDQNTDNTKSLVDDPRLVILSRTLTDRHNIWDFAKANRCADELMAVETREQLDNVCGTKPTRRSRRKRTSRREVSIV